MSLLSCGKFGQSRNSCVVISRSGETAPAESAGCSRNVIAVLSCHTWPWRSIGSSRIHFLIGMHCFKSAADRSSWRCMKSNTPNVSLALKMVNTWPKRLPCFFSKIAYTAFISLEVETFLFLRVCRLFSSTLLFWETFLVYAPLIGLISRWIILKAWWISGCFSIIIVEYI